MMSQKLITFILSITLHILVISYFTYVTAQSLSRKNQAQQDAPVISIALTQATQSSEPEETTPPQDTANEPKLEPAPVAKQASIVVPKKQKKIIQPPKEVIKPKTPVLVKKTKKTKKQADDQTKKDLLVTKQQKTGALTSSLSTGAKGSNSPNMSRGKNNQLISAYSEKLRQEIEKNKQYPRKARRMKSQGVAIVQFHLNQAGEISLIRLASSSGNKLLDNAALRAVQKSRSVGKPPVGYAQSITLNIEFN